MSKQPVRKWHDKDDKPKKKGIYKTSRRCLIPKGKRNPIGNGYAEWNGKTWDYHKNWGNHMITCEDGMWYGPVDPPDPVHP